MKFINKNPIIYVLSGKAGSGKSFVASRMKSIFNSKGLKCIDIAYASYLKNYIKNISGWDGNESNKPRDFLQQLGVELIKNKINSNMLIDRIVDDILVYSYFFDVIIISDARFIEEIETIRSKFSNVVVIKVIGKENNLNDLQKVHVTETALDDYSDYDFIINNYGDNLDKDLMEVLK